jgi:AAA family ATP:ADP antiporter
MAQTPEQEFGKWRSFIWPVHNFELKKLIPMLIMAFFISFIYTILRDSKDALVVTDAGAEALPFLKVCGTVPGAIVFMILYSQLSNMVGRAPLFYITVTTFLVFFGSFPFIFHPFREQLHLSNESTAAIQSWLPLGWIGLTKALQHWTSSLFYIMSELWGSAVLSLCFWGFANQITRVSESKRFYVLFGLGFNLALIVSGPLIKYLAAWQDSLPAGVDKWGMTLNYLMAMVVIGGLIIMSAYYWMDRNVLPDPRFYDPKERKREKTKLKMGVWESFVFIARSPYLLCLTIVVMSYGIAINLIEVTWKSQVKLAYPDHTSYVGFMGGFSFVTGVITVLMMLFVGGNVIRQLGWRFGALFTPVVLIITGMGFFGFMMFGDTLSGLAATFATTPLMLAVIFGAAQNIMSKSSKYSLFDPTKEMSYIPLDPESKVKGKAAVDVVGARLGKSGGSLIQILLFSFIGGIAAITPYVAVILVAIVGAWLVAVVALNKMFLARCKKKEEEDRAEQTAAPSVASPA